MQKRRDKMILSKRGYSRGVSPVKKLSNTFTKDDIVARTSWDSERIFLEISQKKAIMKPYEDYPPKQQI